MPRCPLCDSELVGDSCPLCSAGAPTDEPSTQRDAPRLVPEASRDAKQARSAQEEKESWYAAAGMERPAPAVAAGAEAAAPAEAPLTLTDRSEDRGDAPVALLLLASVAGHLTSLALSGNAGGLGMSVGRDVLYVATAFALLSGSSFARVMVYISLALGLVGVATISLLSISGAILAAIPLVLMLVAFVSHERWVRLTAAGIGAALFLGLPLVQSMRNSKTDAAEALAALSVPGGHFRSTEYRFEMKAPAGVLLFEGRNLVNTSAKQGFASGGLLSMFGGPRPEGPLVATPPQLVFLDEAGATQGLVTARKLPAQLPLERELDTLDQLVNGRLPQFEPADQLVPDSLSALEHQGLYGKTRAGARFYVVLARAADGRSFFALCTSTAPQMLADKRCAEVLAALTIAP